MRLLFVGFAFAVSCSGVAQQQAKIDQANVAAETSLLQIASDYQAARSALTKAIDRVTDPARQKLLREALAANEAAWDKLIDTEATLRQACAGSPSKPDIRIRRLIDAEYASKRIENLKDWAAAIIRNDTKQA